MIDCWRIGIAATALLAASTARAECSSAAAPGAQERKIDPLSQTDTNLVISMTMMPAFRHVDYDHVTERPACDLGPLAVGGTAYELWGDEMSGWQRKALPARKGEPIALLVPVTDVAQLLASAKTGRAAQSEGFMLAVVTKANLIGWRFYTAIPDAAVLRRDMADALAGTSQPIFRTTAGNRTTIFMHHGSGTSQGSIPYLEGQKHAAVE